MILDEKEGIIHSFVHSMFFFFFSFFQLLDAQGVKYT